MMFIERLNVNNDGEDFIGNILSTDEDKISLCCKIMI